MSIDHWRRSFGEPSTKVMDRLAQTLSEVFSPSNPFVPPRHGESFALSDFEAGDTTVEGVLGEVYERVIRHAVQVRHPMAVAHMVPPPLTISVVADLVIGAMNQCAFIWEEAPTAAAVEREVIAWLAARLGFSSASTGILTSGGTASNCLAMSLALRRAGAVKRNDGSVCVVASDQAHLSVDKAAAITGLTREAVIRVRTNASGRLSADSVCTAARDAAARGLRPVLFVCTAGTSNAGSVEPLSEFMRAAAEFGAWCHVDAAHGGMLCLSNSPPEEVTRWREADSLSWDPHKSLYVSYASGALFVRERGALDAFRFGADYALLSGDDDPGYAHLEGSRRFEALKIWMAIRHVGVRGYAELTDHSLRMARLFSETLLRAGGFDVIATPDTNIVCFRISDVRLSDASSDAVSVLLQQRLYRHGGPLVSRTRIAGRVVLRAVLENPLVAESDVEYIVERLSVARVREIQSHLHLSTPFSIPPEESNADALGHKSSPRP